MDDDILDCLEQIHQALASAQHKVMRALAKQRLTPDNREQLKLELAWITRKIDNAP